MPGPSGEPRRHIARARLETSAGGVVYRLQDGEPYFLLIRDSYRNWGFPKGHLEIDEAADAAAMREVREETGLEAVHLLSVEFVDRLTADPLTSGLPYHRAIKKVPCLDLATGQRLEPSEPNGVKFETFVFDAMPIARKSLVMETSRLEEFAPIKNASGEDSPASSRQAQSDRHASWLEARGVRVARDSDGHAAARIEIQPRTAMSAGELAGKALPDRIDPGSEVVI